MFTTVLVDCPVCEVEREAKICERCEAWNVTCEHLVCMECQFPVFD